MLNTSVLASGVSIPRRKDAAFQLSVLAFNVLKRKTLRNNSFQNESFSTNEYHSYL